MDGEARGSHETCFFPFEKDRFLASEPGRAWGEMDKASGVGPLTCMGLVNAKNPGKSQDLAF